MIHRQPAKYFSVTPPAAIKDNSAFTTAEIDTVGFVWCNIVVYIGAVDIGITVLRVQESATSGSGFATITSTVVGTATDKFGAATTLPTPTGDNAFWLFEIDMRGHERYLDLNVTIGNGSAGGFVAAWAELYRAAETPHTNALQGCAGVMAA